MTPQLGRKTLISPVAGHAQPAAWFVVQLKPNAHLMAERHLEMQGYEVFLPRRIVTRRKNGRFLSMREPVFPGYAFTRFGVADGSARKVNNTRGVSRLVSLGGHLATLPDHMVEGLKDRFNEGQQDSEAQLTPGQRVKIFQGPFVDMIATIEATAPGSRIWVLLELAGRPTRLALSATAVEAT